MENKRRSTRRSSVAWKLLSALESTGLASGATFAGVLWLGLAVPGLPLLPGLAARGQANVAISRSRAVLGVQESSSRASVRATGRQAWLMSLLLPTPDSFSRQLAVKRSIASAASDQPLIVALSSAVPPAPQPLLDSASRLPALASAVGTAPIELAPSPASPPPASAPPKHLPN